MKYYLSQEVHTIGDSGSTAYSYIQPIFCGNGFFNHVEHFETSLLKGDVHQQLPAKPWGVLGLGRGALRGHENREESKIIYLVQLFVRRRPGKAHSSRGNLNTDFLTTMVVLF